MAARICAAASQHVHWLPVMARIAWRLSIVVVLSFAPVDGRLDGSRSCGLIGGELSAQEPEAQSATARTAAAVTGHAGASSTVHAPCSSAARSRSVDSVRWQRHPHEQLATWYALVAYRRMT